MQKVNTSYGIYYNKNRYVKLNQIENLKDMDFIEDEIDKNNNIIRTINDYFIRNKTNNLEIKIENKLLESITIELKDMYNLSNIKIAKYLGVSKYKVDRIINNKQ